MCVIETDGLTKRYGDTVALESLDLRVESGEVFGFLGPNGAGKSTTIDILLDLIRPTSGSASVFGLDPRTDGPAIRRRCGVVPDGCSMMPDWTGRDHVAFEIESRGVDDDPDVLLERVGLADDADRVATDYSRGMTQRLLLAMALAGDPDLLILDEPSTGLDPNGVELMQEIIRERADAGTTVFFSSHLLAQVEAVCDRVGILRDGNLVAVDDLETLRSGLATSTTMRVTVERVPDDLSPLSALESVASVRTGEGTIVLECSENATVDVLTTLEDLGAGPQDFDLETASLQDVFSEYTATA
ncbi:copper ABC transporter ATP-binding protein [Natrinema saccharevitans]|uniref:Copper ABC transporter ATP-binding protein n=1 Tax=Natrinema saccharevitans TaxID=301967 RepID=A0A1S8AZ04_9EURY|nr:ABC transporter ATP-binding protein [Natrinema saccharevitans]OLZ41975.1 copper ABC transporter ATP-binding protein [Natrinema saccharevitans]